MPDIRPFRGVLYNPQKIKALARVVTEPYDVISPAQQNSYYKNHPYNIIRLILGKHYCADNSKNNQYARAKSFFADWLKKDILLRDKKKSIYIYAQNFPHKNKRKTRTGFVVLLKLEDFSKSTILPHENTFSQPVQDRLRLLQNCRANLSPIFALFCDPQGKINKLLSQYKRGRQPYITIEKDRVLHKIWRMDDKKKIATIQRLLKGRQIFIADGHHRYEAALNYKAQMQGKKGARSTASFNYVMTHLVATADRGLTILPTHRVIKIKAYFKSGETIRNLNKFFDIQKFSTSEKLFAYLSESCLAGCIFGVYLGKNRFYRLKLKNTKVDELIGKGRRSLRKDLDVTVLHGLIEHILKNIAFEENIYYTRDAQEAIKLVDEAQYQLAFFLRPATVMQVKRTARAREKMPHKSTYFYPKLLTGLVINKFN